MLSFIWIAPYITDQEQLNNTFVSNLRYMIALYELYTIKLNMDIVLFNLHVDD